MGASLSLFTGLSHTHASQEEESSSPPRFLILLPSSPRSRLLSYPPPPPPLPPPSKNGEWGDRGRGEGRTSLSSFVRKGAPTNLTPTFIMYTRDINLLASSSSSSSPFPFILSPLYSYAPPFYSFQTLLPHSPSPLLPLLFSFFILAFSPSA